MFNATTKGKQMKVRLFCDDENGVERFWKAVDLRDCFADEDDQGYYSALTEISKYGRVWIGGGAAQAYLAMRA
jgi:hypothetical protein